MALSWILRKDRVTSVVIGASRVEQLENNIDMMKHMEFSEEELTKIEEVLQEE